MSEEDVLRIAKKLEKIASGAKPEDGALEMLIALREMPITIEVLQKSRIGMTINDLRKKSQNDEFATLAKSLIKTWKKMLDNRSKNGKASDRDSTYDTLPKSDSIGSNMADAAVPSSLSTNNSESGFSDGSNSNPNSQTLNGPSRQTSFQPVETSSLVDSVRIKCREMLLNSLRWTDMPDGTLDPEIIADKIENKLFEVHKGTTDKYKAAVRSRVFNLRDKKNRELRENVLCGTIDPDRFAIMAADEMASQQVKEMRQKFTKQAIDEYQMTMESGTATDMFKCGKCRKKNCTYTQVQTRSADEPMTTFVFCRECGNRWKFC